MPKHLITTIVPTELAPALSELAAQGLRAAYLTCEEAGYLMTFANAIAYAEGQQPRQVLNEVPGYWRPRSTGRRSCAVYQLPTVLVTISEDTRREVALAAGTLARRALNEDLACLGSYCQDWAKYTLHDGCDRPTFHV